MKKHTKTTTVSMEDNNHDESIEPSFSNKSDICKQLLDRYGKSSAPQHRHLCATAAATRSIIESESLPLTPLSYFAATIDAIFDTSKALDAFAVSALSTFLSIVLPLIPDKAIAPAKAVYAVGVLSELVGKSSEAVSASSVRAMVKCIGVLVGFFDFEDWESAKLGFEILLKFSIDKRPKVRKCAQDCLVKVFKSFESPVGKKKASKSVLSMFTSYKPLVVKLTAKKPVKGSSDHILSKPEHLEVLHMLNVLKHFVPYLSIKVNLKVLSELQALTSSKYSPLTRHIFDVFEAMFKALGAEVSVAEAENIIKCLVSYVSVRKNPIGTVLSAATLLKRALNMLHVGEPIKWNGHFPLVVGSVAGLVTSDASTASQASSIIKELIEKYMDKTNILMDENLSVADGDAVGKVESNAVESICDVFVNLLNRCDGLPNEHILDIISVLFFKLGDISYVYMKGILLKLAESMAVASPNDSNINKLQECIGSAIVAMGPDKLLELLPISFNEENLDCSNIWLLPILRKYVVGSSLGFFMEHVVPLAESFERSSREAKKSVTGLDLQSHARSCWGLLPTFCDQSTDTHKNFASLAKSFIPLLKRDTFMVENISIALQVLVNQNKSILGSDLCVEEIKTLPKFNELNDSRIKLENKPSYSKKVATRNLKAIASCSEDLLVILRDVLFESHREKHSYLKDAITCVASIADLSVISNIFISSLERFQLINDLSEDGSLEITTSADNDESNLVSLSKEAKRFVVLELASSIADVASEDLIDQIFNFIKHTLQGTDEIGQREAYITLNKILKKHSSFCTSKFVEVMDMLLDLKSPVDITALKSRFICFQTLLVHAIESLDEENTKAFLILNEIILTLKDSGEEGRKVANDVLLGISSTLRTSSSSSSTSGGPYQKLINMIMGYLSGSSPHIKSGAVSALSILVHNDANLCILEPDLVPTVLELLESKAIEVIKAVLGFLKVLVLSSQVKDLQNHLTEIVNRILPWSSVSRNHFKSKVTVILEILMRKCGSATIKSIAPEKYKTFVKNVLENRQGKSSSKEDGSAKTESKPEDSSFKPQGKISKENDKVGPTKQKREDKPKDLRRHNRPMSHGKGKVFVGDKPDGNNKRPNGKVERRKPRKFNGGDRSGGKRKRNEVVDGDNAAFPKRKKAWKKQKIEKMRNAAI